MQHDRGTIKTWKDDKGFGFIRPEIAGLDVFVHIRDFGSIGRKPRVGDTVFYQPMKDGSGRLRAADVRIEGVPRLTAPTVISRRADRREPRRNRHRGWFGRLASGLVPLTAVIIVAVFVKSGHLTLFDDLKRVLPATSTPNSTRPQVMEEEARFTCASNKHRCPEMTSCAEAVYYLQHCPGTVMDGDGDGLPCEDQWCGTARDE